MYEKNHISSIEIKLIMAKFYIIHLPNNIKLTQLFATLSSKKLSWKQQILLFVYYHKIHK